MIQREIIKTVPDGNNPLYSLWSSTFTVKMKKLLNKLIKTGNSDNILYIHIMMLGSDLGLLEKPDDYLYREVFGSDGYRGKLFQSVSTRSYGCS